MLRMVSILAVLLALIASGCSDKATDQQPPATTNSGQEGGSSASSSAIASPQVDARSKEEPKHDTGAKELPDLVPPTNAGAEPETPSGPATKSEGAAGSSTQLDPAMQKQVAKWLDQMASEAAVERRAASDALSEQGEGAMPYVVWGLRNGSPAQRQGAATYLIGRVSPRDDDAVKALIEALTVKDVQLQRAALQAVERLPDEMLQQALPALETLAQDEAVGEAYRSRAVRAIAKLGPAAEGAVSCLITLAKEDKEMNVRRASYFAISKVASASAAEEFFQGQLTGAAQPDLRRLAAKWLGTVTHSDRSLQCLIDAFSDADESVRLEAVDALVAIGKPAVPALIKSLDSTNVDVRRHCVVTLGKMGVFAADAAAALQARLTDPDQQVRELAAAALKLVQTH